MTAEEWRTRCDLAAAYRLIADYGWDDIVFTHLSARVPGRDEHFLLNPYGFAFDEITAESLVKVDLDGVPVERTEYGVNPAGFTIHSAVHGARDDAGAVMHLHTDAGVAVSAMSRGLMPLSQHSGFVCPDLAYHEWEGVALDLDERSRLVRDLGDRHFMLLWNHGTLAVGDSVASCFLRLYYFEKSCRFQVNALAADEPHLPSDSAIAAMEQFNTVESWEGLARVAWPALLRRAERLGLKMPIHSETHEKR